MKEPIALFHLAKPKYGGWPTFTAHLYKALELEGYDPQLYKVGDRTELRQRPFGRGVAYQNVSTADAVAIANGTRSLVTATDRSSLPSTDALLHAGASIVIHDPTELNPRLVEMLRDGPRVVVIRKKNVANLRDLGIAASFAPHPYVPYGKNGIVREWNAVAFSRLDWDKHTDIIAGANALLPVDRRCRIYGAANRMYAHHKLDSAFPGWKESYFGGFPVELHSGVELAQRAIYAVDMSAIKGDGGGTQYTFLEAWDAGAALVVNEAWLTDQTDAVVADRTAYAVSSAQQLAAQLTRPPAPEVIAAGQAMLKAHAPKAVVEAYLS